MVMFRGSPRSPAPASLHLLALQLRPSLLDLRAPEHQLFTPLPSGFNPGEATIGRRGMSMIGRGVPIAPPFGGQFCRLVGAQSTT